MERTREIRFGHNNVSGRPTDSTPVCALPDNTLRAAERDHGKQIDTRRLISADLLPVCGKWTEGKYYAIYADLPGDKVLTADDRGIKMIALGYGFKSV